MKRVGTQTRINKPFDYIIVFGEGPVKPVLTQGELSEEQCFQWADYKASPLTTPEPNFFCLEKRNKLLELAKIEERTDGASEEKVRLLESHRQAWQHEGSYALKTWGKQNALAAGYALYKGRTKKVILSGGRTIPGWAKRVLPQSRLKEWPSEALLMKDIIKATYGVLYEKKYGEAIDRSIIIEDSSTNTLENFAFTLNNTPQLLAEETHIGLLTANHHLKRVGHIAQLFSLNTSEENHQSAQELLQEIAAEDTSELSTELTMCENMTPLQVRHEKRWLRGLTNPEYLTYWLGYVGLVENPLVLQNTLRMLKESHWKKSADQVFSTINLVFDEYADTNVVALAEKNENKYGLLVSRLQKLCTPEMRNLPPPLPL
jgi:hypothetical protein